MDVKIESGIPIPPKIWLVKAGFQGSIAEKFKDSNKIATGWEDVGNISIDGDRDDFRARVQAKMPGRSPNQVGSAAGQLWAFARTMEVGDFVITPVKLSREVLVGKVTGSYKWEPSFDDHHQRTRTVKWFNVLHWDDVSPSLRTSFSQWLTISRPNADFMPVIKQAQGEAIPISSTDTPQNESVAEESHEKDLSELAEESIRQKLRDMSHIDFQLFVGGVFAATGFTVIYNSAGLGADGGVDILLSKESLGASERIVVQVKHTSSPVGEKELRDLMGTLKPHEWGLMVSLNGVNSNINRYWRENRDRLLRPLESSDLVKLIQNHYENLSEEYKAFLPLKKTYVPLIEDVAK